METFSGPMLNLLCDHTIRMGFDSTDLYYCWPVF